MITNANPAVVLTGVQNRMNAELYGLSTDTKPITDVPNGSVFVEIDTGKSTFSMVQQRSGTSLWGDGLGCFVTATLNEK